MDEIVVSKLRRTLKVHHDQIQSWSRLATAIYHANDRRASSTIDRRTLERLCGSACESVSLKLGQLAALDTYFIAKGEGPLFARQDSLLDIVAESPAVNFFVATKYHPALNTEVVSRWDLRGITRLLRTQLAPLELKIWDVLDPADWSKLKTSAEYEAKIGIGSPIASCASEALLAEMVGVQPEKKCPLDRLPFFLVGSEKDTKVKSAFVRGRSDARKRHPLALEGVDATSRALVVEKEIFVQTREEDYALLVAQRHPRERQIHVVLCGLTGPSSYELAKTLQQGWPPLRLPELQKNQEHPPILTAVFKMAIDWGTGKQDPPRETRKVTASCPVGGPTLFHFVDGEWKSLPKDLVP